jgi:hypothetical protein
MDSPNETHFLVLYSAHHERCGHFIERADFRVATKEDLIAWSHDMATGGSAHPLPLHCDNCAEDLQATHIRIVKDADPIAHTVVPELEIERFNPDSWILKPDGHL